MRLHPLLAAVLAVCALTLAACSDEEPVAEPTAAVTETATGPASPAEPVTVEVDYVDVQLLGNAVLRGEEPPAPSDGVVDEAVGHARAAIERYINAQFVDPATRYGAEGHTALLEDGAADGLDEEARRGLGELDLDTAAQADDPVQAQAVVLTDGDDLLSVTMTYDASFTLEDGSDADTLRQQAQLYFPAGQEGDAWRAELVEMTVELPEEPTP